MDPVDPSKRVTRSQLPLPDSQLSLTRSPLKDARIAQRSNSMQPQDPAGEDADTDDEILLSPGKNRHLNSQVNTNSKRSASPPLNDEYDESAAPQDGRELKRLKRDPEETDKRAKQRDSEPEGSDIENTNTNLRTTATPSHIRNLSEPVLVSNRKPSKPRSTSKQTPASPKGKGRARSVPVFPVLDLSKPQVTPWHRRARSRSPSKERDSPKLQPTFAFLTSIPDEGSMPPPALPSIALPTPPATAPEPPTVPAPAIFEPPFTPMASSAKYRAVFATPMSPLTPLPETPRPFQSRQDFDGLPRTLGWGFDISDEQPIEGLPTTSSLFPPISATQPAISPADDVSAPPAVEAPVPSEVTTPQEIVEAVQPAKGFNVQSRLPWPSVAPSTMGPPPVPAASSSNPTTKKSSTKASSKLMGPPHVPIPSSSSSTSTSGAPKNAFSLMMASSARGTVVKGKGKGKEKEKEKPAKPAASTSSSTAPSKPATMPSTSSSSSSAVASSSKVPAKDPACAPQPKEKEGKGKGKEKEKEKAVEEKPKEDTKKASLKAKMRPREKPKPLPLPIHVRLPDENDGERTSTPTAVSRPETPTVMALPEVKVERFSSPLSELAETEPAQEEIPAGVVQPVPSRFSSPLTDIDESEADPVVDDALQPPASSSPDMFLSPAAGPQLELAAEPEVAAEAMGAVSSATPQAGEEPLSTDVDMSVVGAAVPATPSRDVFMDSVDEPVQHADVSMLSAHAAEPNGSKLAVVKPKSRVAKPRAPAPLPVPADRVTRSASLKRKEAEGGPSTQKKLFSFGVGAVTADGNPAKKQKMNSDHSTSSQAGPSASPSKIPLPSSSKRAVVSGPDVGVPASPSKRSSFADATKSSAARASLTKTPVKSNKPVSAAAAPSGGSPSPIKNKLARASSLFTARPPPSFTRTFTGLDGSTSSLQTLASALEKLRMPPPERPNTSMGFSKDDSDKTLAESSTHSADGRTLGLGRPSGGLQRASTVASIGSSSSTSSIAGDPSTSSGAAPLKSALVQRPLTAFMGGKGAASSGAAPRLAVGTGSIMRGVGAGAARGGATNIFGPGRVRSAPKVSRNPGLPSVIASPVKGGGGGDGEHDGDDTMLEEELMPTGTTTITTERVTSPRGVTFDFSSLMQMEVSKKGKEKERLPEEWRQNASRRASMALQDLSKSMSLPPRPVMGPPGTPHGMRSSSSSYPSSSASDPVGTEGMRRSTRIAKTVGDEEVVVAEPTPTLQPLTVLKGCIVFVDIISDVGDDSARSFITDMLKSLGARVLGSVGQTCTHIVYKNGLRSTYTRYKALSDPKPHVVGMEWVVQSAEKRTHQDETPYLIDMDDMNTTVKARRKSMVPRLLSDMNDESVDGDYSFEGSSSSMIMDDELGHLPPLERARLRKAAAIGL
ncbi:hypothetical protein C8R45DRAFT_1211578 [Mycena sanguinolenta]|nr:hypothetical protein C8R45DRAFT_1211578 [Mycena sanguinolenta]